MADTQSSERNDPHNWNSLENYLFLHEKHLDEHPLVLPGCSLNVRIIPTPSEPYDVIVIEGIIRCANRLLLEIHKFGDIDRTPARRVRISLYKYNAWFPAGHNVLRYDNQHRGQEDIYHRHEFSPETGESMDYREMPRREFPVMHEILDELARMFPIT